MSSSPAESKSESDLPPQELDTWFLELLACPSCEFHLPLTLTDDRAGLLCGCGRYRFPVVDGIPDLLPDSATLINENAHPEDMVQTQGNRAS